MTNRETSIDPPKVVGAESLSYPCQIILGNGELRSDSMFCNWFSSRRMGITK